MRALAAHLASLGALASAACGGSVSKTDDAGSVDATGDALADVADGCDDARCPGFAGRIFGKSYAVIEPVWRVPEPEGGVTLVLLPRTVTCEQISAPAASWRGTLPAGDVFLVLRVPTAAPGRYAFRPGGAAPADPTLFAQRADDPELPVQLAGGGDVTLGSDGSVQLDALFGGAGDHLRGTVTPKTCSTGTAPRTP